MPAALPRYRTLDSEAESEPFAPPPPSIDRLLEAIRSADSCLPKYLCEHDLHDLHQRCVVLFRRLVGHFDLASRHAEVVLLNLLGLHTKAAATILEISPKTVEEHWRRVYRKLGATSRSEAVAIILLRDNPHACTWPAAARPHLPTATPR